MSVIQTVNSQIEKVSHLFLRRGSPGAVSSFVRISLGIIYLWFGFLKFSFVGAGGGAAATLINNVWGPYIDTEVFIHVLAMFECTAGLMLIFNLHTKMIAMILVGHIAGTFFTVFLDPSSAFAWDKGPLVLTIEGQYIVKNFLIIAACFTILALDNKRLHERLPVNIVGLFEGNHPLLSAKIVDLSVNGLSLRIDDPCSFDLKEGDCLEFAIYPDGQNHSLIIRSEVRYVNHGAKNNSQAQPQYAGCLIKNADQLKAFFGLLSQGDFRASKRKLTIVKAA